MTPEEIQEIKDLLENHEKRIFKIESYFSSKSESIPKQISVKEFIMSRDPKGDVQKTLVIGYYLEKYKNLNFFNAKDLEEGFREAKEKVPDNINDKVSMNIKAGYMMEAKEKKDKLKAWSLTNTGETFLENGLKADK